MSQPITGDSLLGDATDERKYTSSPTSKAPPFLTVEHAAIVYRRNDSGDALTALQDISLDVSNGEFVSIVGPSGCGKTSLLEAIAGLRPLTGGRISVEGQPATDARVRRRIGVVFQEDTLFPWRSVLENITFALEMWGVEKAERIARARRMLDLMNLSQFEKSYMSELSGGMRQRVSLARTLVTEPDILLLDEPFAALDAQMRLVLGTEISSILHQLGATALLVTHSIEEAAILSDRVVVMTARPGRVKTTIPAALGRPRGLSWAGTAELAAVQALIWEQLRAEMPVWTARAPS